MSATIRTLVILLILLVAISGCRDGEQQDVGEHRALVASPVAGDYYAAELTYFSGADFERHERIFGLMKVVAVDGDEITLVTENGGSPERDVALQDLAANPAAIAFDENERILIMKTDLLRAFEAGHILAARR